MVRHAHLAGEAVLVDIAKLERECTETIAGARAAADAQVPEGDALGAQAKATIATAAGDRG